MDTFHAVETLAKLIIFATWLILFGIYHCEETNGFFTWNFSQESLWKATLQANRKSQSRLDNDWFKSYIDQGSFT